MKKLHDVFGMATTVMSLVAIVIAIVLFVNTLCDPYTSFPAWAPLAIVGIYYSIGLAVLGIIRLATCLILKRRALQKKV